VITFSNRTEYLAAHTRPEVKDALREEAKRRGIHMSPLVSEILEKALEQLGYDMSPKAANTNDVPLPFEAAPQEG
jgi:hypothetical protein